MKKIQYHEKAIVKIIEYLSKYNVELTMLDQSIIVKTTRENENKLFINLSSMVVNTKYMVQKDTASSEITIFNGSV